MADELSHRGPDHFGYWNESIGNFYLSHKRLSIIDLSNAGSQPMISNSGRYVISFNGEIYNNHELRKITKDKYWIGTSDTDTLLRVHLPISSSSDDAIEISHNTNGADKAGSLRGTSAEVTPYGAGGGGTEPGTSEGSSAAASSSSTSSATAGIGARSFVELLAIGRMR